MASNAKSVGSAKLALLRARFESASNPNSNPTPNNSGKTAPKKSIQGVPSSSLYKPAADNKIPSGSSQSPSKEGQSKGIKTPPETSSSNSLVKPSSSTVPSDSWRFRSVTNSTPNHSSQVKSTGSTEALKPSKTVDLTNAPKEAPKNSPPVQRPVGLTVSSSLPSSPLPISSNRPSAVTPSKRPETPDSADPILESSTTQLNPQEMSNPALYNSGSFGSPGNGANGSSVQSGMNGNGSTNNALNSSAILYSSSPSLNSSQSLSSMSPDELARHIESQRQAIAEQERLLVWRQRQIELQQLELENQRQAWLLQQQKQQFEQQQKQYVLNQSTGANGVDSAFKSSEHQPDNTQVVQPDIITAGSLSQLSPFDDPPSYEDHPDDHTPASYFGDDTGDEPPQPPDDPYYPPHSLLNSSTGMPSSIITTINATTTSPLGTNTITNPVPISQPHNLNSSSNSIQGGYSGTPDSIGNYGNNSPNTSTNFSTALHGSSLNSSSPSTNGSFSSDAPGSFQKPPLMLHQSSSSIGSDYELNIPAGLSHSFSSPPSSSPSSGIISTSNVTPPPSPSSSSSSQYIYQTPPGSIELVNSNIPDDPTRLVLVGAPPKKDYSKQHAVRDKVVDDLVMFSRNFQIVIKGGTLNKLIERLTYESSADNDYIDAFLLTYRNFISPHELLEQLLERYRTGNANIADEGVSEIEATNAEKKAKIIRLRVGAVLKRWLTDHYHDYHDPALSARLESGLAEIQETQLQMTLNKTKQEQQLQKNKIRDLMFSKEKPAPIVPKGPTFDDWDVIEVARQLCLIEQGIYQAIHPKEALNQAWNKDKEKAPNIIKMITFFNRMSKWVSTQICLRDNFKERVKLLKKFMQLAWELRNYNNFDTMQAVLSGLNNASVFRMKASWAKVQKDKFYKSWKQWTDHITDTSNNNNNYRHAVSTADPPIIPYLGVYLTDLTFTEDGNSNYLKVQDDRSDIINFEKMRRVAVVIKDICTYQQTPYNFDKVPVIFDFFASDLQYEDDGSLFKRSRELEPPDPSSPGNVISPKTSSRGLSIRRVSLGVFSSKDDSAPGSAKKERKDKKGKDK